MTGKMMSAGNIQPSIRIASLGDIDTLVALRLDYLAADGHAFGEEEKDGFSRRLRDYFAEHLRRGDFVAIMVEKSARIASAAFLIVAERPPAPAFPNGRIGTIMNVLTYPEYRRQGFATQVVQKIIAVARDMDVSALDLLATPDGIDLYDTLGFTRSQYLPMRIAL